MTEDKKKFTYSIFWNCGLIICGSLIQAIALKSIAIPHNFVPGGIFGVGSLIFYKTGWLNPGLLYVVLNVPMFILGYIFISRRFLWYSALAMGLISFFLPADRFSDSDQQPALRGPGLWRTAWGRGRHGPALPRL